MDLRKIASRVAAFGSPLSERPDYGSGEAAVPRGEGPEIVVTQQEQTGVIRKTPGKNEWCVKSEKNPDWNGGCYPSKEKAEERLRQVEMFKHLK